MPLNAGAAEVAITRLGATLGLDRESTAAGILRLADVRMALALRSITTERGLDPRDYALVAYGGCGPLHAAAIARELAIPRLVVPPSPSTFSAWGMLAADLRHDLVRTVLRPLAETAADWAGARFEEMRQETARVFPTPGGEQARLAVDLRYAGQIHTVSLPLDALAEWDGLRSRFDGAHRQAYGYAAPDVAVELLNLRLTLTCPVRRPSWPTLQRVARGSPPFQEREIYSPAAGRACRGRVYARETLRPGDVIEGPAAVEEASTTTLIEPGDRLKVNQHGFLDITLAV